MSTALNRLQNTLLEDNDVVVDTRKRNTILTLVAWLKRILQTPASESSGIDAQLSDLLPTELLLSKLMPQLPGATEAEPPAPPERSAASSKRFQKQRNNRYNTVGVSKEELADARLYLQKKLLSENLTSTTNGSMNQHHSEGTSSIIDDDNEESRRKSLNLDVSTDFSEEIDHIFDNGRSSFSKSIDILPSEEDLMLYNVPTSNAYTVNGRLQLTNNTNAKNAFRRKGNMTGYNPIYNPLNNANYNNNNNNSEMMITTDTEDDHSEQCNNVQSNAEKMNKFALKKLKMKRANTIDIPKTQSDDNTVTHTYTDGVVQMNRNKFNGQCIQDSNQFNVNKSIGFKPKTNNDYKFYAFLNKQSKENHPAWVSARKSSMSPHSKSNTPVSNWSNKFDHIKNAFEKKQSLSPIGNLNTKNSFTHAATSPFMPVKNNKPPVLQNGHPNQYPPQHLIIAQNSPINQQYFEQKPQLKSYKSMPSPTDVHQDTNGQVSVPNSKTRANAWANKNASVDNESFNKVVAPATKPALSSAQPEAHFTNHLPYSANPLQIPTQSSVKRKADLINTQTQNPFIQNQPMAYTTPNRTPVSPHISEFPTYTYTCTDYTQPSCVSTYVPNDDVTPVQSPAIPETTQPMRTLQPTLGAARLSNNMKAVDYNSSSEYLSEPNRSPQPFYLSRNDEHSIGQEMTARTQIMKYPECQTATVINKPRRYSALDEHEQQRAMNLKSYLKNNVTDGQPIVQYNKTYVQPECSDYESDVPQLHYTQPKPMYIAPIPPYNPNVIRDDVDQNGYNQSSQPQYIQPGSESLYGSQQLPVQHTEPMQYQLSQQKIEPKPMVQQQQQQQHKLGPKPVVKMNRSGSQYIQPKLNSNFHESKIKIQKRQNQPFSTSVPGHVLMNNVSNLDRSNTINQRRIPPPEIKRKQSLPAQGTDFIDSEDDEPRSHYLPTGILKRSKSGHTLALLQQFESREHLDRSSPPPPPLRQSQPALNKTGQRPPTPKQVPVTQPTVIKPIVSNVVQQFQKPAQKPVQQTPQPAQQTQPKPVEQTQPKPVEQTQPKPAEQTQPKPKMEIPAKQSNQVPVNARPKEEKEEEEEEEKQLSVAEKIQNWTNSINARKFNKTFDDDSGVGSGIRKSKSGSLLTIPKQFETIIAKSEVEQKQRTVAAYFSGSKSPQGLQRSSSQHNVTKSKSLKELSAREFNDTDDNKTDDDDSNKQQTKTKSAHHMKILKKQKQTSNLCIVKSQTMPHIADFNLLDESNVDDAFEDLFSSFNK